MLREEIGTTKLMLLAEIEGRTRMEMKAVKAQPSRVAAVLESEGAPYYQEPAKDAFIIYCPIVWLLF